MPSAPDALARALDHELAAAQAERIPSVSAAVVRGGEVVWERALGLADVEGGIAATTDTQYRAGSITKTFTATLVMQLRDEGALSLDDPLDRHIEGAGRAPTIRRMLSHTTGLQREPPGDRWESLDFSAPEGLAAALADAEEVLPAGERWHYSNLAFALLGELVERLRGRPWEDVLRERILDPLGLARTTRSPDAPAATGYLVEPWAEAVRRERPVDTEVWAPSGQLWTTVRDLCRWCAHIADPDERVLARGSVEEMRTVLAIHDHERWTRGYGLGLNLIREGERVFAGHGGAMPGFIAGMYVSPKDRIGAVVLTNSGVASVEELTLRLAVKTIEAIPADPEPWQPDERVPDDVAPLLGSWWSEGFEYVFRWRRGRLEVRGAKDEPGDPPSVLERLDDDRWRTVSGPEHGELLRLARDEAGAVTKMNWAGYAVTREPRSFTAE